jgi:hypothetical protein
MAPGAEDRWARVVTPRQFAIAEALDRLLAYEPFKGDPGAGLAGGPILCVASGATVRRAVEDGALTAERLNALEVLVATVERTGGTLDDPALAELWAELFIVLADLRVDP